MIALQKTFDAALNKSIVQIKRELIHKKFKELGIRLSEKQLRKIVSQAHKETFTIELEDTQLGESPFAEEIAKNGVKLKISEKEIQEITSQFSIALEQAIPASVQEAADLILKQFKRRAQAHVKTIRSDKDGFKLRLRRRWKKAFELFDLYLSVCNECGSSFNKQHRRTAAKENDFVFDVLTRLHARGCQIGLEVITLLEGGFADGAHARWRTLNEIVCVAMFVKSHGQDVAESYLLHDLVETYKAAKQYQIWCRALNQKSLSQRTIDKLQRGYDSALNKFGKSFRNQYGWAAKALANDNPNFSDIEKDIGLEKFRPYYRLASHNVHANPRGIFFKMGLPHHSSAILAGASDAGLADPAHGTAISLFHLTTALLLSKANIDSLAMSAVLRELQREIGEEFLNAHDAMMKRHLTKRT